MKKLNFKKLWIVSDKERAARVEVFDKSETVVLGENRSGKSSLIKSIYAALGADPKKNNDGWVAAETKLLIEFDIDGATYFSLRIGSNLSLFNGNMELVATHYGVTKSSDTWTHLLDAQVMFPGARGNLIKPWPSALFMPFYIDQDTGLSDTWSSFLGLEAYKNYKDTLVDFHTGIRPKEYYKFQAEKSAAQAEMLQQEQQRAHLDFAQSRLNAMTLDSDLEFDPAIFENEIAQFLTKQNRLNEQREKVRLQIRDLQGMTLPPSFIQP